MIGGQPFLIQKIHIDRDYFFNTNPNLSQACK